MTAIASCVPNFSEGRRSEVVDEIVVAMDEVEGVTVLDRNSAFSQHRSVVTLVGPPAALVEAAVRGAAVATRRIDLNQHRGDHPRMGATDVVPFVPMSGTTMDGCVELARACGERIGNELQIPVFLYEHAATRPDRRSLAQVRRGQFEQLKERIGTDPDHIPDFGPPAIHPTAGATAVGARTFLIAFNVNLDSNDVDLAERIAEGIRERDGGFPAVRAAGCYLVRRDLAQVCTHLLDYDVTSIATVYAEIERRAREAGVEVLESELAGLAPAAALPGDVPERVKLRDFDPARHILERKAGRI